MQRRRRESGNFQEHICCKLPGRFPLNLACRVVYIQKLHYVLSSLHIILWYFIMSPILYKYCVWKILFTGDKKCASMRDKSVLLLSIHLFFLPIILKILLKASICFSNFSYIASYLAVTSYTLYMYLNCIYTSWTAIAIDWL